MRILRTVPEAACKSQGFSSREPSKGEIFLALHTPA
jgi:hypothetical protein